MTERTVPLPTCHCLRCGHVWTPRKSPVYLCPRCKSPKWAEEEQ